MHKLGALNIIGFLMLMAGISLTSTMLFHLLDLTDSHRRHHERVDPWTEELLQTSSATRAEREIQSMSADERANLLFEQFSLRSDLERTTDKARLWISGGLTLCGLGGLLLVFGRRKVAKPN